MTNLTRNTLIAATLLGLQLGSTGVVAHADNNDSGATVTVTAKNGNSNKNSNSSNQNSSSNQSNSSNSADDQSSSSSSEDTASTDTSKAFQTPVLAYGGGLTKTNLDSTKDDLKISDSNYKSVEVTGNDVDNYLHMNGVQTSGLFSSVFISRSALEGQNTVKILTPDNITLITKAGYETPLLTAGISNLDVKIASTSNVGKVSGQSALAGVYKALESEGVHVSKSRAAVAQKELNTTAGIVNNQNPKNYKDRQKLDTQLASALADMKTQLADIKNKQVTDQQIEDIVNKSLKNAQLGPNSINGDDKQNLENLGRDYLNNKDTVLSPSSVAQYKKYASNVAQTLENKFGVTPTQAQGFIGRIWNSIVNFFKGL